MQVAKNILEFDWLLHVQLITGYFHCLPVNKQKYMQL